VEQLAWAAGLFEGEGTVTLCGGRPRLAVKMNDEQAVRRFAETVKAGKVYGPYGPYKSSLAKRQHFVWIGEKGAAEMVAALLWPWLGPRVRTRLNEIGVEVL